MKNSKNQTKRIKRCGELGTERLIKDEMESEKMERSKKTARKDKKKRRGTL